MEKWHKVDWSEVHYVSNFGNVKTVDKTVKNWPKGFRVIKGRDIKPWLRNGYPCVSIEGKTLYVHRLVAEYFVMNKSDYFSEVNHLDGDKGNPNYLNLEWTTHAGNMRHASRNGLFGFMRPILRSEDGLGVRMCYQGASCVISSGYTRAAVTQCLRGGSKTAFGFTWEYVSGDN